MTTEEGFRVSDLVFAARGVLNVLELGEVLTKDSQEAVWLRKAAEAAQKTLPEEG